jgi:hypothetical protein
LDDERRIVIHIAGDTRKLAKRLGEIAPEAKPAAPKKERVVIAFAPADDAPRVAARQFAGWAQGRLGCPEPRVRPLTWLRRWPWLEQASTG